MNLTCVDVELLHFHKMFFRWAENCCLCRGCDDPASYDDTKMEVCQDGNRIENLNISYEFVKVLLCVWRANVLSFPIANRHIGALHW